MQAGATPLHETAFNDFEEAAELLIAAGADVDALNVVSGTRLPFAVLLLQLLADLGAVGVLRVAARRFTCRASKGASLFR